MRKQSTTAVGALFQQYAELRAYTNARIAKEIGVSPAAVTFIMLGRKGVNGRSSYTGAKRSAGNDLPTRVRIAFLLEVPREEVREAARQDAERMAEDSVRIAMENLQVAYRSVFRSNRQPSRMRPSRS